MHSKKKVTVLGGGGGQAALLQVLRDFDVELAALCNAADDGGGSGRLMREYAVHHPGEVRQALRALAGRAGLELGYRFTAGQLEGQTLGNLLLVGLECAGNSFAQAVDRVRAWYGITALVRPITTVPLTLSVRTKNGKKIVGQANLVKHLWDEPHEWVEELSIDPVDAPLSPEVASALRAADYIIVAMGDLYSSIAPSFCLSELQRVWNTISAKIIWFPNAVVPVSHAHYQTTSSALGFLQRLCPAFRPDYIIVPDESWLKSMYAALAERGYMMSQFDASGLAPHFLRRPLLQTNIIPGVPGDSVERSPIQYDPNLLREVLTTIII